MKKYLLLFIFSSSFFYASAQNYDKPRAHLGVRAAFNTSTESLDVNPPESLLPTQAAKDAFTKAAQKIAEPRAYTPGIAGGIFYEIPLLQGEFSVTPEIDFLSKGTKYKTAPTRERLNYLTMPVIIKWHPSFVEGLSIGAGPEPAYLVSAKTYARATDGSNRLVGTIDLKAHDANGVKLHNWDWNLTFESGYDFSFIPGLGVDFRFNLGLRNLFNAPAPASDVFVAKNRTYQLGLRYMFGK